MKHAREDYNRIQDPENLIPEDEPVVLLRAQDKLACLILSYYVAALHQAGATDMAKSMEVHLKKMNQWPKKKIPDLPKRKNPVSIPDFENEDSKLSERIMEERDSISEE